MTSGVITLSTDGSCLRNPGGAIGWAWVDHTGTRFDSGGAASGTNQIAELTAVLQALRAHPGPRPLLIESDSQYTIRSATEWLPGWKRKGWRTSTGSPVQNLELIQAIDAEISGREGPVKFRWVRGHFGHKFNERADELALAAARDWAAGRGVISGRLFSDDDDELAEPGDSITKKVVLAPPVPVTLPPAPVAVPAALAVTLRSTVPSGVRLVSEILAPLASAQTRNTHASPRSPGVSVNQIDTVTVPDWAGADADPETVSEPKPRRRRRAAQSTLF